MERSWPLYRIGRSYVHVATGEGGALSRSPRTADCPRLADPCLPLDHRERREEDT